MILTLSIVGVVVLSVLLVLRVADSSGGGIDRVGISMVGAHVLRRPRIRVLRPLASRL